MENYISAAQESLDESKDNYSHENFYASVFFSRQVIEFSLKHLFERKFNSQPKIQDPVFLLKELNPPQEIHDLCGKVLRPYHPNQLHSPRLTGELLHAAEQVFTYIKNSK